MKERKISTEFFRRPPERYNCAQSLLMGFREEFGVTQQEIDDFASYTAGRAPGGFCGALYGANYLLAKRGLGPVTDDFAAVTGAPTCREIKTITRYPCPGCVLLGDQLVERELKKKG